VNQGGNESNKRKKFSYKPDIKAYTEFKQQDQYATWIEDTVAVMRAQGLGELLDPSYVPYPGDETEEFDAKQAFTYMMLQKKVLTLTGKRIVKTYKNDYDAQAVLYSLAQEAMKSTYAVLSGRQLLTKLTSQKFDPRNGKVSAMEFITTFETMVETYNDMQVQPGLQLSDEFQKTLLQASLSQVSVLRAVSDREQEALIRGGAPFDFDQYLSIVKTQAILFDESIMGRRSAHVAEINATEEVSHERTSLTR
jgi:hypothetical protein